MTHGADETVLVCRLLVTEDARSHDLDPGDQLLFYMSGLVLRRPRIGGVGTSIWTHDFRGLSPRYSASDVVITQSVTHACSPRGSSSWE